MTDFSKIDLGFGKTETETKDSIAPNVSNSVPLDSRPDLGTVSQAREKPLDPFVNPSVDPATLPDLSNSSLVNPAKNPAKLNIHDFSQDSGSKIRDNFKSTSFGKIDLGFKKPEQKKDGNITLSTANTIVKKVAQDTLVVAGTIAADFALGAGDFALKATGAISPAIVEYISKFAQTGSGVQAAQASFDTAVKFADAIPTLKELVAGAAGTAGAIAGTSPGVFGAITDPKKRKAALEFGLDAMKKFKKAPVQEQLVQTPQGRAVLDTAQHLMDEGFTFMAEAPVKLINEAWILAHPMSGPNEVLLNETHKRLKATLGLFGQLAGFAVLHKIGVTDLNKIKLRRGKVVPDRTPESAAVDKGLSDLSNQVIRVMDISIKDKVDITEDQAKILKVQGETLKTATETANRVAAENLVKEGNVEDVISAGFDELTQFIQQDVKDNIGELKLPVDLGLTEKVTKVKTPAPEPAPISTPASVPTPPTTPVIKKKRQRIKKATKPNPSDKNPPTPETESLITSSKGKESSTSGVGEIFKSKQTDRIAELKDLKQKRNLTQNEKVELFTLEKGITKVEKGSSTLDIDTKKLKPKPKDSTNPTVASLIPESIVAAPTEVLPKQTDRLTALKGLQAKRRLTQKEKIELFSLEKGITKVEKGVFALDIDKTKLAAKTTTTRDTSGVATPKTVLPKLFETEVKPNLEKGASNRRLLTLLKKENLTQIEKLKIINSARESFGAGIILTPTVKVGKKSIKLGVAKSRVGKGFSSGESIRSIAKSTGVSEAFVSGIINGFELKAGKAKLVKIEKAAETSITNSQAGGVKTKTFKDILNNEKGSIDPEVFKQAFTRVSKRASHIGKSIEEVLNSETKLTKAEIAKFLKQVSLSGLSTTEKSGIKDLQVFKRATGLKLKDLSAENIGIIKERVFGSSGVKIREAPIEKVKTFYKTVWENSTEDFILSSDMITALQRIIKKEFSDKENTGLIEDGINWDVVFTIRDLKDLNLIDVKNIITNDYLGVPLTGEHQRLLRFGIGSAIESFASADRAVTKVRTSFRELLVKAKKEGLKEETLFTEGGFLKTQEEFTGSQTGEVMRSFLSDFFEKQLVNRFKGDASDRILKGQFSFRRSYFDAIKSDGLLNAIKVAEKSKADLDINLDAWSNIEAIAAGKEVRFRLPTKDGKVFSTDIDAIFAAYAKSFFRDVHLRETVQDLKLLRKIFQKEGSLPTVDRFLNRYIEKVIERRPLDSDLNLPQSAKVVLNNFTNYSSLVFLGLNMKAGIINTIAGVTNNFIQQGIPKMAVGFKRFLTDKGQKIADDMQVVSSTVTLETNSLRQVGKGINDVIYGFMMGHGKLPFGERAVQVSEYLGELTGKEFRTGIISDRRHRQLIIQVGRTHGFYGESTRPIALQGTLGRTGLKFKVWALTQAVDSFQRVSAQLKNKPIGDISVKDIKDKNLRQFLAMSSLILLASSTNEDVWFKRQVRSILGVNDPDSIIQMVTSVAPGVKVLGDVLKLISKSIQTPDKVTVNAVLNTVPLKTAFRTTLDLLDVNRRKPILGSTKPTLPASGVTNGGKSRVTSRTRTRKRKRSRTR